MNDIDLSRYLSNLMREVDRREMRRIDGEMERIARINATLDATTVERITAWVEGERPTLGGGK